MISENLADFFLNKILNIRDNLEQYDLYAYERSQVHFPMTSFKEVEMCVQKALTELLAKSYEQDQTPTKIVKSRIYTFIKPYIKMVNLSMIYGQFDVSWKSATLQPLQKKLRPDLSSTNYRLVSNLKFISKPEEKCVLM